MSAIIIDGKKAARIVFDQVAECVARLTSPPALATLLVGEDPSSRIYVTNKRKQCVQAGMRDLHQHLPADISQNELITIIDALSADPDVTGILLQLPLPDHLDQASLIAHIDPAKDVDGLTETNAGRLALGRPGLRPCTPSGVMHLLEIYGAHFQGANAVVVGRSDLVGRPQAKMLLDRNATVTICHSHTRNVEATTRIADILVVAAGVPQMLGADAIKPGAIVIDVGMHRLESGLCGDVDTAAVTEIAAAITPVPGGVGPMTIAMLLKNTLMAVRRCHRELETP